MGFLQEMLWQDKTLKHQVQRIKHFFSSTVGHTETFMLDTSTRLSASMSNALGDESSTQVGVILSEQVMSLIKESQRL